MAERQLQQPQAWLPYAGFALTLAGIIYQGGILKSNVDQSLIRIAALEAAAKAESSKLEGMNIRGERNEAKLDFLVEEAQRDGKR